jgi:hypothetical protein
MPVASTGDTLQLQLVLQMLSAYDLPGRMF